ncbi:MAG: hypothetical protein AAF205_11835, partial [Pseudomonadota bacterium]
MFVSTPSVADDGFYVAGFAGAAFPLDQETGGLFDPDLDFEFETGFLVGGAVGYRFDDLIPFGRLRLELEYTYREADADEFTVGDVEVPVGGDTSSGSVLLNALVDFELP